GEVDLLDRMSVRWLLVDPARLRPDVYERLQGHPSLALVAREEDAHRGERREIYRVTPPGREDRLASPTAFRLTSISLPAVLVRAGFYAIPFTVSSTGEDGFEGGLEMGARILQSEVLVNVNDEVRRRVPLVRSRPGEGRGDFWIV